ncbi:MAG: sulfatase [Planctomycetota bacterium]
MNRLLLCFLLTVTLAPVLRGAEAETERKFSSFIIITVDTLRWDHLGCHGYDRATSPALDEFAGKCVRFENAFSAAASTRPSMIAMHTSSYPGLSQHLFDNGNNWPPIPAPTIASQLQDAGCRTAAFVGNFVLREECGLATGFAVYDATLDSTEKNRYMPERVCTGLQAAAADWLKQNYREPFFLWVHFQDPHGPYTAPEPFNRRFPAWKAPSIKLPLLNDNHSPGGVPKYQVLNDRQDFGYYVSQYDGEISFLDSQLAKFFKLVDELGLLSDTVIFFTADHGEALGEQDWYFCHGHAVTPELTHVPLLMHVPGMRPSVESTPVSLIDIAPTIADLGGLDPPEAFLGVSLLETLAKGKRNNPFFAETSFALAAVEEDLMLVWGRPNGESGQPENRKVFTPAEIAFYDGPITLHDYREDPFCLADIKDRKPRWFRYLRGACQEYLRLSARTGVGETDGEIDEETRRALKALGYLSD